jgi:hypothetical protein
MNLHLGTWLPANGAFLLIDYSKNHGARLLAMALTRDTDFIITPAD